MFQDFANTWAIHNFQTSEDKPISHAELVRDLLWAVMLLSELAVIKVKGDAQENDTQTVCNREVDGPQTCRVFPHIRESRVGM